MTFLLLCATGCIDRDVGGDQTTYDYAWWVPATLLLVSVVAFPAGLVLRKHSGRIGIGVMILSPILAVLIFPATILDKVKVDSQHFETHYGFWFSPSKHNVHFDDLSDEMRLGGLRDPHPPRRPAAEAEAGVRPPERRPAGHGGTGHAGQGGGPRKSCAGRPSGGWRTRTGGSRARFLPTDQRS